MARRIITLTIFVAATTCIAFMAIAAHNFDFHAFYCAGRVAREGANPYHTEPLRTCELSQTYGQFSERMHGATLPAPFPGYVIAAMEPISLLPFATAARIWTGVLLAAIAVTVLLLMRLSRFSAAFVLSALCLSVGVTSLGFGEFVPLFLCALCMAAVYAKDNRWDITAAGAAACMIEPHLGLPVCIALFVWRAQTRVVLLSAGGLLAAMSLAALGVSENVEYLTRVLPYHALSEIGSNQQFSLSVIVHALGASDAWALRAGFWSYAIAALGGVLLAPHAVRHFRNSALLVLVPAIAVLVGGSFLHVTQMAAAIPLVLLLLRIAPRYRISLIAATVLLAIPWSWIYQPLLIGFAGIFAFYIAWEGSRHKVTFAAGAASLVLAVLFALDLWSGGHAPDSGAFAGGKVSIPAQYAEASWGQANLGYWSSGSAVSWAYRVPTWGGLLIVVACACVAARRRESEEEPMPNVIPLRSSA